MRGNSYLILTLFPVGYMEYTMQTNQMMESMECLIYVQAMVNLEVGIRIFIMPTSI